MVEEFDAEKQQIADKTNYGFLIPHQSSPVSIFDRKESSNTQSELEDSPVKTEDKAPAKYYIPEQVLHSEASTVATKQEQLSTCNHLREAVLFKEPSYRTCDYSKKEEEQMKLRRMKL